MKSKRDNGQGGKYAGLSSTEKSALWRALNKKKNKSHKARYRDRNRDKLNRSARRRYAEDPDKCRESSDRWKEKNRSRYKAYQKQYMEVYYAKHRDRLCAEQRTRMLMTRYGLTPEDVSNRLREQKDLCAFCKKPFTEDRPPVVDHCHSTKKLRGMVHRGCNTLIGQVEHKRVLIQAYLGIL